MGESEKPMGVVRVNQGEGWQAWAATVAKLQSTRIKPGKNNKMGELPSRLGHPGQRNRPTRLLRAGTALA